MESVDNGDLEAELSLVEEEYFGERFEEKDIDSDLESCNDNLSSSVEYESETEVVQLEMHNLDAKEIETVREFKRTSCKCTKKMVFHVAIFFTRYSVKIENGYH